MMDHFRHKDHEVYCSDICKFPKQHMRGDTTMVWTDPPWEGRMVKFFETMAKKQSGLEKPNRSINDVISAFFYVVNRKEKLPVYVEYSQEGTERIIEWGETYKFTHVETVPAFQTNGNPYHIICFNTEVVPPGGLKGWEPLRTILHEIKPYVVFDPFAGIGQTARQVLTHSKASYTGVELNPNRYIKLKESITKHAR